MNETLLPLLKYPFVILVGFMVAFVLTPLVQRLAPILGVVDMPDARRIHKTPIPRCGLSIFLGFHAACAAIFLFPWAPFTSQLTAGWWWRFLVLSSLLFMVGFADDSRGMRPWVKFGCQIAVASLAFAWNIHVGKILGFPLPLPVDFLVTVFWFLLIINAFNLIDGIDGLATGLAAIAAMGLAGSFFFRRSPGDTLVMLGLVGACMGFLRYNANPASIFLGDSGSMFLGFALAAIPLETGAKGTAVASIGVPLLAVGVPLLDTALAVWRRGARRLLNHQAGDTAGRMFQPDLDHVHHRLLRSGLSQRATASSLHAVSLLLVAVGLLSMLFRSHALGIYILAFVVAAYVIMRHLAHVELWDSGRAIVQGLSRPSSHTTAVIALPLLDLTAMALALAVACYFSSNRPSGELFKLFWLNQLPLSAGIPFLFLVASRAYHRVWSRARVSEFFLIGAGLVAGILVSTGLSILVNVDHSGLQFSVINLGSPADATVVMGQVTGRVFGAQTLIYIVLSVFLVVGIRILPRAIQDALVWSRRITASTTRDSATIETLIYGAGDGCALYMAQRNLLGVDDPRLTHVAGILDEDLNLHRRYIHGYPVFGGREALESVLAKHRVDVIILTEEPTPDILRDLFAVAAPRGIALQRWRATIDPLTPPAPSSSSSSSSS